MQCHHFKIISTSECGSERLLLLQAAACEMPTGMSEPQTLPQLDEIDIDAPQHMPETELRYTIGVMFRRVAVQCQRC